MNFRTFTIASCLKNVQQALADMKPQTIYSSWKKLWPQTVNDFDEFTPDEMHHSAVDKVVKLAGLL